MIFKTGHDVCRLFANHADEIEQLHDTRERSDHVGKRRCRQHRLCAASGPVAGNRQHACRVHRAWRAVSRDEGEPTMRGIELDG